MALQFTFNARTAKNASLKKKNPLFFYPFSTTASPASATAATATTDPHNRSLISRYFSFLHSSPNITHLRHLHARLLVTSLYSNVILSSKLVIMYSHHRKLDPDSLSVFFHMPHRNIYSWNIIIGELSRSNSPNKSIDLFLQMWRGWGCECGDVRPDEYSFPLVLRTCAGSGLVELGISVHGLCVKMGLEVSLFVASALVSMYLSFGNVFRARVVFDEMPKRDPVLWTSLLAGYAQRGKSMLGLEVFREMVSVGVELDGIVMVSLLLVCGQLGWIEHGKSVHGWCIRNFFGMELNLGNAVVDMYVKCAVLTYAHRMFEEMPERDVFSWSSLIMGYGLSGNVSIAVELFDQMRQRGVKPNNVTFLGVLSACAHGGLVGPARRYFKMLQNYGVVAELKHYATMVDCLGRAGLLEEAERLVDEMPMEPDAAVLGAILGGCRVHNNVEIGERVAQKLIRLEPEKAGYFVLLSNMYAAAGRFEEAVIIRDLMKEKDMYKAPGCSLIESKNSFPIPSQNQPKDFFEIG